MAADQQPDADDAFERAQDGLEDLERLAAYAQIPGGSVIRLVGTPDGTVPGDATWTERVEVGTVGDWALIYEGDGRQPTHEYNQLVDAMGAE